MSISQHLEVLEVYGATAIRLVPVAGDAEDLLGEGGELAERFEAIGRRPLVDIFRDRRIDCVMLGDGDLVIELQRAGVQGLLRIQIDGQFVVDERVPLPEAAVVTSGPVFRPDPSAEFLDARSALCATEGPVYAVRDVGGQLRWFGKGLHGPGVGALPLVASIPAIRPDTLGSEAFRRAHGVRWAYVAGAMAGGIASEELVLAMARARLLGFFGSGGLSLARVEEALRRIQAEAEGPWGFNLLHNPVEPAVEEATVDLYLKYGVKRVSASAFMGLTSAVVRYRLHGIHRDESGQIICPNAVFAKVSRPEVAERFLSPAPDELLQQLVERGVLTESQAALAKQVPIAEDITAEADSGGHTDRRPLVVLLPVLQKLRDELTARHGYATRPRVGAAGGLGTPTALWGALAMGADYVLTGSVNQASIEAGTSEIAKAMLREASYSDVATGPAPDMFELGAHVQVVSRGSMYARRSQRLYDLYKRYGSMEEIPEADRRKLERQIFRRPLAEVWEGTRTYWLDRDPDQVTRAESDGRHKMALTFRWYLGMTSRWAREGTEDRKRDFQIWCGPSMGGFNDWFAGDERMEGLPSVVTISEALMRGAAVEARLAMARALGVS